MSHFPYFVLFPIFIAPPFLTSAKQVPKYCEKDCASSDNTNDIFEATKPFEYTCYTDPEAPSMSVGSGVEPHLNKNSWYVLSDFWICFKHTRRNLADV